MATASIQLQVTEGGRRAPQYIIENDLDGEISARDLIKFSQQAIIQIAKAVLVEEQGKGFDLKPVLIVDNKYNKKESDVRPFGSIEYIARQSGKDILNFIYQSIYDRSPLKKGGYMSNNLVLYNEVEVARLPSQFDAWLKNKPSFKDGDKIRFVNFAPYANKNELDGVTERGVNTVRRVTKDRKGRVKNGGKKFRKPNGTYTLAYRAVKRKYKGNAIIKYEQVLGSDFGLTSPARGSGIGRIRQKGRDKGRTYVYPSILVYIKEGGIL